MKERQLQDSVIAYMKQQGIYCIKVYGSGRTAKGAPDLLCCVNGKFVAMELKVDGNEMQSDQRIHKKRIEASGGLHYEVRSLGQAVAIVEKLGGSNADQD